MDTYSLLRQFADSWMLLAMTLFFLGVCIRVFLPRMRPGQEDAASVIFRNDAPACSKACPDCGCATSSERLNP